MRSVIDRTATCWALLGGLILFVIVLVTVFNVAAFALDRLVRLFGGTVSGLPGYEDFVRLAISAAALMLLPYCQLKRGHVVVDLFAGMLPRAAWQALTRTSLVAMAALALFLAYWMALGMQETRADGALSRVLGWPEWPFYLPGIVSLLLWAAVAAHQAIAGEDDGRA
ncbi:MAG: TRAP transporter small permease subunit [Gammaproteobacteria bacterium]|nr:TRAP transporter small permease subunit [Gammaproteobacteria bacterium]